MQDHCDRYFPVRQHRERHVQRAGRRKESRDEHEGSECHLCLVVIRRKVFRAIVLHQHLRAVG